MTMRIDNDNHFKQGGRHGDGQESAADAGQRDRWIKDITAEGELGRRIRDMGLIPGTEMRVVGKAPLRDPVALRLRGFTLTMRNNEVDHATVESWEDARPLPGRDAPHTLEE